MSRVKWVKLWLGMSDDEKMKLIDDMKNRDVIFYVWIKLMIQAGKNNSRGFIFLSEKVPYTMEMLSIIFNRPIEQIKEALKVLVDLEMIEIDEKNFIKISNWEKHQNIEGLEKIREQTRKRVEKYREQNKCNADVTEQNKSEIENEIESKIEIDKDTEKKNEICNKNNKNNTLNKNEIENEKIKADSLSRKIHSSEMQLHKDQDGESSNKADCLIESKVDHSIEKKGCFVIENNKKRDMESATEIISYTKTIKGKFIGITMSAIKLAVSTHGAINVKLAIDKAVEANKLRMNYIRGILENWSREGYPEGKSWTKNDFAYGLKSHKSLSFNNFEPRNYDYDKLEKRLLGWEE